MRVVVLNSAQGKQPCGTDAWVGATLRAVDALADAGHTIVASVGLNTWELVLWRAAKRSAPVHVVMPLERRDTDRDAVRAWLEREFRVTPYAISWVQPPRGTCGRKAAWAQRDGQTMQEAECLVPVSVRPAGRLARLIELWRGERRMDARFETGCQLRPANHSWQARKPQELRERVTALRSPLFHLTRATSGPWPGERAWQYYDDVAQSAGYARSGFATLCRIVREQRIRASSFRMPRLTPMVSWSDCDGPALVALVRGRRRYARYAFEPYAIAVERAELERLGARAVQYRLGRCADGGGTSRWEQGSGPDGAWRAEREWRVQGDVWLGSLPPGAVSIVTATEQEAERLRRWCPWPVCCLGYSGGLERPTSPEPQDPAGAS
ncbi:MAG: hypothetical protein MUF54_06520 [Polyangiaceae bacterium]|jgi:hypothetical protein|nr:hypothetical protein [Polyangiaceae bacterium]